VALTKLEITPLNKQGKPVDAKRFRVMFNPNTYSITKSVTWQSVFPSTNTGTSTGDQTDRKVNAPMLSFGGGGSRQLTLELFYDVTEPVDGVTIDDVRQETNKIVKLTRIDPELESPPAVRITWGKPTPDHLDFPFQGVVSQLTQRFTLFRANGQPVRANLNVTFTEFLYVINDQRETDPEFTTRLVKRGDSLSSIAAEVYRDPMLWRLIAVTNELDDPRHLPIGLRLSIPKLG
jgi:hypothetical protein